MPLRLARGLSRWWTAFPFWLRLALVAVLLAPFAVAAWLALWRFAMKLVGIDIFPALP